MLLRVHIEMTPEQEARYRAEHGLAGDAILRPHVRDLLHIEIAGIGADWWTSQVDGENRG